MSRLVSYDWNVKQKLKKVKVGQFNINNLEWTQAVA